MIAEELGEFRELEPEHGPLLEGIDVCDVAALVDPLARDGEHLAEALAGVLDRDVDGFDSNY